ncbi:MAG TPA: phosphoglycerate kinase [Methyloceanibacter sp.]|nr:phosphoglycerate kinase [Methyloceanibacter sp.]
MNDIDVSTLARAANTNGGGKPDFSRIRTIDGLDVRGKRVLVRVDFNVPMQDGEVTDTTRITRVLPTIKQLANSGAKVIVLSHLGRPKGQRSLETSLAPVAAKVAELMGGTPVHFINDCVGDEARRGVDALKPGEVAVLENLRYHAGEEKNDAGFAKQLAELGDLYVDDAFSSSHRAHASVEGITHLLPAYAGLLMMAEIRALDRALEHPARPVMAIAGGAKVSTKIQVLTNLTARMDQLVLAGGMASTFLYAQGVEIGKSLCQPDAVPVVKEIMARAKQHGCEIVLPHDFVVAKELKAGVEWQVCDAGNIPQDQMILDMGPKSVADLKRRFAEMKTLVWNGPVGAFEFEPFGNGTFELMREAARLVRDGKLVAIAGGGDTVAALNIAGVGEDFTYVSTAGGAFLEWLEGKTLPAVAALAENRA